MSDTAALQVIAAAIMEARDHAIRYNINEIEDDTTAENVEEVIDELEDLALRITALASSL